MKGFRTVIINAIVMIATFLAATFSGIGIDPTVVGQQGAAAFDAGEKIYAVGLFFLAAVNTVLRYFTTTEIFVKDEPVKTTTILNS